MMESLEFEKVGAGSFAAMGLGAALAVVLPLVLAIWWIKRKKEPVTTVLVGAATFMLFALVLEKPIQALVIALDHPVKRYLDANPVMWALVGGLFPGVFEETGRLVAYKTLLKKQKNRETGISHGIGHGGMEVMLLLGLAYVEYIAYGVMINTGAFRGLVAQTAAQMPDQVDTLLVLADQLANLRIPDIALGFVERVFAVLFHIGASILVFYACRDKKKFWLYPLAILLHTALDFIACLAIVKGFALWVTEGLVALFGVGTFCLAYFLLYRRDTPKAEDAEA